MGCDIHIYVEVFDEKTKKWNFLKGEDEKPDLDMKEITYLRGSIEDDEKKYNEGYYNNLYGHYCYNDKFGHHFILAPFGSDRNYVFFGILGNIHRSNLFSPIISETRGLPNDISDEVYKEYEEWELDAHTISFLTLKELNDYFLSTKFDNIVSGYITLKEYIYMIQNNYNEPNFFIEKKPKISSNLIILNENEISDNQKKVLLKINLDTIDNQIKQNIFIYRKWIRKPKDFFHHYKNTLIKMKELAPNDNFEYIRMIYWFDN